MQAMRLVALLCLAPGVHAAVAPAPVQPAPRGVSIDDVDARINDLKSSIWYLPGRMGYPPPDHTGATVQSDLARYVLRDAELGRLNLSHVAARNAVPAGSNIVPASALAPLGRLLGTETCRLMVVADYWQSRRAGAYHEDMIHQLLQRLPASEHAAAQTRLRALAGQLNAFRSDLDAMVRACDGDSGPPPADRATPLRAYNDLRIEILAKVLATPAATEPVWVSRRTPCPAPAPAPSGTVDAPKRMLSKGNLEDFYPRDALDIHVEGKLRVRVEYDVGGCVQRAAVEQTSGSDLLDQAGINYGFSIQVQPAVVNGKPVADTVLVPITFALY